MRPRSKFRGAFGFEWLISLQFPGCWLTLTPCPLVAWAFCLGRSASRPSGSASGDAGAAARGARGADVDGALRRSLGRCAPG